MILAIIILTLFIYSSPVQAQELIPYQNNPIILKESSHNGSVMPSVLKEQNTYSLWYADDTGESFRVYRMKSANGIDWYDKTDTNVTSRHNASDPFVTVENGQYTLYFASSNYGNISLWESKSIDGIHFVPGSEKEILKSELQWEGAHLSCPAVIKENNISYLFYAGSGVSNWGIGVATSTDGVSWQKCPNNPIIAPGASGQIIKYNDIFYLYFQTPSGLEVQQAAYLNGCNTIWTGRHIVNSALRDPSPLQVGNDLWLYGTLPTSTGLHIGLASNNAISVPTYPIVIIPGMFASWNKDAILHNTSVPFNSWQLNPAVTEYSAIETTLNNKGKIKDKDYFIFSYDWRAPLSTTAENLNQFLQNKFWNNNTYQPVQLIGHSLGGTVARLFAQNNKAKPIKNIVTSGSPLLGALQAYKPLAAGEIDRENNLMWIAEKLILLFNKSKIESDKDTIKRLLPILSDLLPTFSFLKNESGSYISSSIKNTTLI
ncbi:MAG: alpha/beta hydrolase, partial [Candidatus Roizmanbacteria bacterium]|nr:alpha/beta hydrolase [Candidatus Roizmanbacteria bacterium]